MVLDSQLQKNKSDLYASVSMASRSSIQLLSLIALSYSFKHATIADRSDSRRVSSIAIKLVGQFHRERSPRREKLLMCCKATHPYRRRPKEYCFQVQAEN